MPEELQDPQVAPVRTATRRALLGGSATVAAAGVLGGCDAGDLTPGADPEPGSVEAEVDADTLLVEEVLSDVRSLAGWAAAAARRHPRSRRHWAQLAAMHEAHAAALTPDEADPAAPPGTPAPGRVPAAAAAALRAGRAREQAHQDRLVAAAAAAGSGRLARLFASMAAATAQRLALWPASSPSSGAGGRS
ncbi:hypothetical protein [Nocardioides ferulae]|uniref:hypothetical protein n=1 Tax=Nocardioides ferulae TaxID=2340821 RepID=UPI0013DE6C95|nr:hypothetical protein [Nocardioides ferulae]